MSEDRVEDRGYARDLPVEIVLADVLERRFGLEWHPEQLDISRAAAVAMDSARLSGLRLQSLIALVCGARPTPRSSEDG